MKHITKLLIVVLLLLGAYGATSLAQANVPPFATAKGDRLSYYHTEGTARELMRAPHGFSSLVWNAEGNKLAFILRDEDYHPFLGVADIITGETHQLETPRLTAGFNITWTRDGRILFVAEAHQVGDEISAEDNSLPMDIMAIAPFAGAEAERLSEIRMGVGCGGGSSIPADWVYWSETEGFGGFFLTLADTPYGILYSQNCTGVGINLLNPATGESVSLGDNIAKVVVSPDGTRAAGLEVGFIDRISTRVLVYDLTTLRATPVLTAGTPDQLAWSEDGTSLYYSQKLPMADLLSGMTSEQKATINEVFGFELNEIMAYTAHINQVNLATGEDTEIFAGYAYAVGRMKEADGALYFSLIPNLDTWLMAVAAGQPVYDTEQGRELAEPYVMRLALAESSEAALLGMHEVFTPVK